ncbi:MULTISPECIES: UbiX family flavin prenyltransferase [unclassified Helicobacter]|uniref:UbiX family flavin prenyltransferase n=1 Tax=unclassified Helicobacter TaxID=2593540 RepID=UPI000CF1982F|nr:MULTISPECIES: UbiX family flavin prenyltransferase [unclassified Helicobacter]
MKFVVGISGASSVNLGIKFLEKLPAYFEIFLVLSQGAKEVIKKERIDLKFSKHVQILDSNDIGASIASGSFGVSKMAIIPTSMNKLAKIACGIADDLITRSASVMIKEKKTLLLAPRELPFSSIALENMLKLSKNGVIIAPPVLGYYAKVKSLEMMEDFIIGRWFDLLEIDHSLYQRWGMQ